jgi:hypothetical protein
MASMWLTLATPIPYLTFDKGGIPILKLLTRRFRRECTDVASDGLYELMLTSMDWAFHLCRAYRRNIDGFEGRYLFMTGDGLVRAAATFSGGNMKVHPEGIDEWDVRVTFKDAAALRSFLLSRDQDILRSLLQNEVEVEGNANYAYRFAFLSRDLTRRLGIP